METAVILAAGMGTRLGGLGRQAPKGFLKLGANAIIDDSLDRLTAAGVRTAVIVTGHLAAFYRDLAARRAGLVETVHNPRYAETGSFYSLWLALEHLASAREEKAFLLLESDLVYEPRALTEILEDCHEDVILLSGPTGSGDEVWVETDSSGRLLCMSKDRTRLGPGTAGELVGITRVSPGLAHDLRMEAGDLLERNPRAEYETDGLVAVATRRAVFCRTVPNLVWAEIDDERHLARARGLEGSLDR